MRDWILRRRGALAITALLLSSAALFAARQSAAEPGAWFASIQGALGVGPPPGPARGELERELARLREERARLIGVLQENERLRALVGFRRARPELELVPARVIARSTTPYFRVLSVTVAIDREVELSATMPVVVSGGVVGQLLDVSGQSARVLLIADPRSRVDIVSQRNRAHGTLRGLGAERDYGASIEFLSAADEVRADDLFVTSGLGGVFPADLIVGRARSVEAEPGDLFQRALIEPAVDLSRLSEVYIIVGSS